MARTMEPWKFSPGMMSRDDIQQKWPRDSSAVQTAMATLWSLLEWLMKTFLLMSPSPPETADLVRQCKNYEVPKIWRVTNPGLRPVKDGLAALASRASRRRSKRWAQLLATI
jgi:hypothetical protein